MTGSSKSKPPVDLSLQAVLIFQTDKDMHSVENRLASFDQWPLTGDCMCTPERMAEAGFYYCPTENEPDLARCYVCFKELDGWDPSDDPSKEHSRSVNCEFVRLGKKAREMTAVDYMHLEKARTKNRANKFVELHQTEVAEAVRKVTYELGKVRRKMR
ncbi:baculoviral IAP repeat containing deterin [Amblyomma americanum]|uniref:Putative apoptosis inhibitor iap1 n=1 Tax=Amblyomma americanum TaxID=6943 RepID=A0A0C9SCH8_AMBAM